MRSLMFEFNGLLNISFKCYTIDYGKNLSNQREIQDEWFTSPYSQIEPAMSFQMGSPILIIKEKGVIADGMLELGTISNFIPVFDLDSNENFFETEEANAVIDSLKVDVGEVYKKKGIPKRLY